MFCWKMEQVIAKSYDFFDKRIDRHLCGFMKHTKCHNIAFILNSKFSVPYNVYFYPNCNLQSLETNGLLKIETSECR